MTEAAEPNDSTRPTSRGLIHERSVDVTQEPSGDSPTDRLPALCQRVRSLAAATADEALANARQQAEEILAVATAQAELEYQSKIAKVREQLERQQNCELQDARLAARGQIDQRRWDELTQVRDEAERFVAQLRDKDQERYYRALLRFVDSARAELAADQIVVEVAADDVEPLVRQLSDDAIDFRAAEMTAGVVVGTRDGNVVVDHSMEQRLRRLDGQLRLAAREILFEEPA